jgi:hypothetical protein
LFEQRDTVAAYRTVPHFFDPDWSLRSDCYVPLGDEQPANIELGAILNARRRQLLSEGRSLLQSDI